MRTSSARCSTSQPRTHPVYRTSADYISEHSDKTIDAGRCSYIVNLSLGAPRAVHDDPQDEEGHW